MRLADIRLYQGDAPTAESLLRQALDIRKKRYWAGNPDIAAILHHALNALEHPAFRVPGWQVAEVKPAYGVCLKALGRTAEGNALVNESHTGLQSDPRPNLREDAEARIVSDRNRKWAR